MVRFKREKPPLLEVIFSVSIPQWCDSNRSKSRSSSNGPVSIPQWCDSNSTRRLIGVAVCYVSIPQWCDSNDLSNSKLSIICCVSIPQWCDSNSYLPQDSFLFYLSFQFHNGAIQTLIFAAVLKGVCLVSIPQWCDSNCK